MRRFFILLMLSALSLPMGMSVVGCKKGIAITYCNGGDSGLEVGQVSDILLQPRITGISLNYGATEQLSSPVGTDCHGNNVSSSTYEYGSTNINIIDVSPTGVLCAGSWNRNSPAGIPNFTTCTATNESGVAYLTAGAGTATSNRVAVYAHPQVTSIVLGSSVNTAGAPITGCVSQGQTVTLSSATYTGTTQLAGSVTDISSWSIGSGSVATFNTTGNNLTAGQLVVLNGFGVALSVNSAAAASGGSTVYTGTILGGANNGLAGQSFTVAGFDQSADNGSFTVVGSTASTLTLSNASGVADTPTTAATATPNAGGTAFDGLVETVATVSGNSFTVNLNSGSSLVTMSSTATTAEFGTATTTIGNVIYAATNANLVTIDNTTSGLATALQPGATLITAQLSEASSTAGYFYVCPPASITLTPGYEVTSNSLVVDPNYTDPLTATAVDTNGNALTGLDLTFNSTTPQTTTVSSAGLISATYAGAADVSAECLPQTCNPAPINVTGIYKAGMPTTSNTLSVTTPGTTGTVLYMASTNSQYFSAIDFTTGVLGAPVRLPYTPDSMVADPGGDTLYFGSPQELMIISAATGAVTKEDPTAPGYVIGVSPNAQILVISDPVHSLIYLYNLSTFAYSTYGGTGTKAVFSPDNQTVYISGGTNEYVYSLNSGWNAYQSSTTGVSDVTVVSPAVGAFFAGSNTTARSYCPNNTTTPITYYPQTSDNQIATARVDATNDGNHVLGANLVGATPTLYDFGIVPPIQLCPASGTVPTFQSALRQTVTVPVTTATGVTGVPVASNSSLAFLTYTMPTGAPTTGAILPGYAPAVTGAGMVENVTLANGANAPVAGIFSPDNQSFYVGTSGDNDVHVIATGNVAITGWSITGNVVTFEGSNSLTAGQVVKLSGFGTSTFFDGQSVTVLASGLSTTQFSANFTHANGSAVESGTGSTGTPTDVRQLAPNLPVGTSTGGTYATPNLLAVRPRSVT